MQKKTNDLQHPNWLLIADGEPLPKERLVALAANRQVIVLDGAYEYIKQIGLHVDILLGDFDSIDAEILKKIDPAETQVIHTPDQNHTDFEKGLQHLNTLHAKDIFICQASGLRLQHTLHNFRVLKRLHHPKRTMTLFTETENVRYLENTTYKITGNIGDGVALLGFPNATVSTSGLKYDMQNRVLAFEQFSSVSNTLVKEEAMIQISGDVLCIQEKV